MLPESWASVLRDLASRGMRAPVLAVSDGALGFWAALREVWPESREQRCWVHRIANVLDKLPKRLHGRAKAAIHEIMRAETRQAAEAARTPATSCLWYGQGAVLEDGVVAERTGCEAA